MGIRWRGCYVSLLVLQTVAISAAPNDDFPNPKDTYGWSSYRYTRYDEDQPPTATDKEHAILAGGDVKCVVCETILADLFSKPGKKDFDTIVEMLEADSVSEKAIADAATEMERFVERYKKGCNKLFKDNFVAKGWAVTNCTRLGKHQNESTPEEVRAPWACAEKTDVPNKTRLNTYSVKMEAMHYACEVTIARNRDELSDFLANRFKKAGRDTQSLKELYQLACRKMGKCLQRRDSESADARVDKTQKKFKAAASDYIDGLWKEQKDWDKNQETEREAERRKGPQGRKDWERQQKELQQKKRKERAEKQISEENAKSEDTVEL